MNLAKEASRSYLWSQFIRFSEVFLLFLVSLVLARKLGPGSYGVFALGVSFIAFCGFLSATGFGPEAVAKFVSEAGAGGYRGGVVRLVRDLTVVRLITIFLIAGFVLTFRHWVESHFRAIQIDRYIVLILAVFALRSLCDLSGNVFSGLLDWSIVAAARSSVPSATLLLIGIPILFGHAISLHLAFTALLVGQAAALAIYLVAAKKRIPPSSSELQGQISTLRRVLLFGLFVWIASMFIFVLTEGSDLILLGWLLKDPRQVGWYAVGASLAFRPCSLVLAWMALMGTPVAAKALLTKGLEGLGRMIEATLKLTSLSLIPTMLLVARFAPQLVTLLYSARYEASVPVARLLCCLLASSGFLGFGLHGGVLYLLNRERTACAVFGGAALFNMLIAIPMIKSFGPMGAALATGLSFIVFASAAGIVGITVCPIHWPWRFSFQVAFASLVATVSTLWVVPRTGLELLLACLFWGIVFAVSLLLMKPLDAGDVEPIQQINPRLAQLLGRLFAASPS